MTEQIVKAIEKASRTKGFTTDHRAQTEILHTIAIAWKQLPPDNKTLITNALVPVISRLHKTSNPSVAMEQIMKLHEVFPEQSKGDISKSLKSMLTKKNQQPDPDEHIYPKDGWIGMFMDYARDSEVPVAYHYWSAVTILGAAMRHKVYIDRGKFDLRMNWYTLLTGDKSIGKSLSKDLGHDILVRANKMLDPTAMPSGMPTALPTSSGVRVLGEDSTKESIIKELEFRTEMFSTGAGLVGSRDVDSTGILIVDELANFLGRQSFNVESKIPFLTAVYGSKYYKKATATGGEIELRNCALSLLACCAPSWLLESITPIMFSGGFLDRFRIVHRPMGWSKREYATTWPGDPVIANLLAEQLTFWMNLQEPLELVLTNDANRWYEDWYSKKKKFIESVIEYHGLTLHRFANQLIKLAGELSASEFDRIPYIHTDHMHDACIHLENEDDHLLTLMGIINTDPVSNQLDEVLKTVLAEGGMISQRKLHDRLRRKKGFMPYNSVGSRYVRELLSSGNINNLTGAKSKTSYYVLTEGGINSLRGRILDENKLDQAKVAVANFIASKAVKSPSA